MPTCFVIQPFDAGKFDKRYAAVFGPAIKDAGLEPYRVDQDPDVDVPIDAIENGISSASVCLADITTDNPNVWYELGFAFASGTPVVMICSNERTGKKYPFDIQHRTIISYDSEAPQDFERLKGQITSRLKAISERGEVMQKFAKSEQVAPIEGLSQPELVTLAGIAGGGINPGDGVSLHNLKGEVEQAGLTSVGFALGLRRLRNKGFVEVYETQDYNDSYSMTRVTETGWEWIEKNESSFIIKKPEPEPESGPGF